MRSREIKLSGNYKTNEIKRIKFFFSVQSNKQETKMEGEKKMNPKNGRLKER
jgi:hypothetical protein